MAQPDFAPPQKRMRFDDASSPPAQSPSSATTPYIQLPGAQSPSQYSSFNSPQPLFSPHDAMSPPMGTPGGIMGPPMGPPQRPADRQQQQQQQQQERQSREQATDMNNLTDVMYGTGVDLKAEEAMMQASYRDSQQSFNTQSSVTMTPASSFNASQPFHLPSFGPLSTQSAASQEEVEDELIRKHKAVARQVAERKQHPLYDPFLQINVLRTKLQKKAFENGIRLNLDGLYVKTEEQRPVVVRSSVGPDGVGIVAPTTGSSSWISENAQLGEVFSLLSLAANERMRNLTEDSYALCRGRQATSDGVVDPTWTSLATGSGQTSHAQALPLSVSRTAWDAPESAISPMTIPAKRKLPPLQADENMANVNRLPTPPTEPSPTPKPTKSYSNDLAEALRGMAVQELEAEKERLAARERRKRAAVAAASGSADGAANGVDGSPATPGTATPGTPSAQVAPDFTKISKKEQARLQKLQKNETEDVLRENANSTAHLALGGRKFSWMKGPAAPKAAPPRPSVGTPGPVGGPVGAPAPPVPPVQAGLKARDQKFGEWKESGKLGGGIQVRDLTYALERDGKAKKSLAKVLSRMSSVDRMTEREYKAP